MPTNLYGPGDNYHPTNSHVLPALIRRFHEAVDDLGEPCVFALERWSPRPDELTYLNVGTGLDLTIRELVEEVALATGYKGKTLWDLTKPDGTPKKQLDVSRLAALGWRASIPLKECLSKTVHQFRRDVVTQQLRL